MSIEPTATLYLPALACLAASGLLLVVQLLIADIAGIRRGHRAGFPVAADPSRFHFRAMRAHANLNESIAAFVAVLVAAMVVGAPSWAVNLFSAVYLAGRIGHAVMYYANLSLARSVSFGIGLVGILGVGVAALLAMIRTGV